MLFIKKTRFSVTEKQIKKDFLAPDGTVVLKLNLRYPQLNCPKGDPLLQNAVEFYPRLAEGLAWFAENDLLKKALKTKETDESFVPYSVWMRWENTFADEKYISFLLEIAVSDGKSLPRFDRKTQVWERKFGTKCRFSEFFTKEMGEKILKDYVGEENKRIFDRQLFVMTDSGFDFYLPTEKGFISVSVPKESA